MIERGHSDRFWSMVSRVIPDYEEYARWLNENGVDLDLWISPHEKYLGHQGRELSDPDLEGEDIQQALGYAAWLTTEEVHPIEAQQQKG